MGYLRRPGNLCQPSYNQSINPIFRIYLVENNEGQFLTRAETVSQREKRN